MSFGNGITVSHPGSLSIFAHCLGPTGTGPPALTCLEQQRVLPPAAQSVVTVRATAEKEQGHPFPGTHVAVTPCLSCVLTPLPHPPLPNSAQSWPHLPSLAPPATTSVMAPRHPHVCCDPGLHLLTSSNPASLDYISPPPPPTFQAP